MVQQNIKRERERRKNNYRSSKPHKATGTGGLKLGNRAGDYNHEKIMMGQLKRGGNNRSFNEGPKPRRKRKMEQKTNGRNDGTAVYTPASASKFNKHKKFGRK